MNQTNKIHFYKEMAKYFRELNYLFRYDIISQCYLFNTSNTKQSNQNYEDDERLFLNNIQHSDKIEILFHKQQHINNDNYYQFFNDYCKKFQDKKIDTIYYRPTLGKQGNQDFFNSCVVPCSNQFSKNDWLQLFNEVILATSRHLLNKQFGLTSLFDSIINNQQLSYNEKLEIFDNLYSKANQQIDGSFNYFLLRDVIDDYFINDKAIFTKHSQLLTEHYSDKIKIGHINYSKESVHINIDDARYTTQIYGLLKNDYLDLTYALYVSIINILQLDHKPSKLQSFDLILHFYGDKDIQSKQDIFIHFFNQHKNDKTLYTIDSEFNDYQKFEAYTNAWFLKYLLNIPNNDNKPNKKTKL